MLKLPKLAYEWAIKHLLKEGDTDLFPSPFELDAIKFHWAMVLPELRALDVASYAWRGGRRFVVPKDSLAFRVATQLDPVASLVLAALLYKYGPLFERSGWIRFLLPPRPNAGRAVLR